MTDASQDPSAPTTTLTIRRLDDAECLAFLRESRIGRIAYSHRGRIDIEPIHLVLDDMWLFGRTSGGTKISMLRHHPWVAVEVDRLRADDDWISVVVHGTFHELHRTRVPADEQRLERAIAAVRRLSPTAFSSEDPTPWRQTVFGISIADVNGRAATPPADPR